MRDPNLHHSLFLQDRVLSRERLVATDHLIRLQGAALGDGGVTFSCLHRLVLKLGELLPDLSSFDRLCLTVLNHSPAPLVVGLHFVHESSSLPSPCVSFSGGREELPPGEWQELKFPRESMGTYGSPRGWSDVRSMEISFAYDRDHIGPDEVTVTVRGIHGERREVHAGPRLSETGLAAVIGRAAPSRRDDNLPTGSPLGKNDAPASSGSDILVRAGLLVPPPHPYAKETADEILEGRIMGQRLSLPIQWDFDPLAAQEWTHFLNRHHFLRELVRAAADTGEPQYAEALDKHLTSWICANPVPVDSNGGSGPVWETLSAAWRLREWLWIRRLVWSHPELRPETRMLMLRAVWEHCRHLRDHRGHPNNWIIVESAALAVAGLSFPEFREAEDWTRIGIDRLTSQFRRQFYDDGVHFEISPLYHALCAQALLEVRVAAQAEGMSLPAEFCDPLERSFEYIAALCRPDFTWPSLNDAGSADSDYTALMRFAGDSFDRDDFRWIGAGGTRGIPPAQTFRSFPCAGIVTMRSHYGSDANFLVFRAGPAGAAHAHDDALSLDVTGLGVPRLVDPGVTSYAPDPLTDYYRSAHAHATILVDGRGPGRRELPFWERVRPAGNDLSCRIEGQMESAIGVFRLPRHDSTDDISITRTVVFVRHEYWVVQDVVHGAGEHDVSFCWQFAPGRVQIDPETLSARFLDARGPRFELAPVLGDSRPRYRMMAGSLQPLSGWVSLAGHDVPAHACTYLVRASLPVVQEWLLIPFSGTTVSGVSARRERVDGAIRLWVSFPNGAEDEVIL